MIEVLQSVLALIVTLSILVTFHEFGHYWVARLCNVHVLRFSVGFGKPIFMKRGKAPAVVPPPEGQEIKTKSNEPLEGTEFAVAAIPLGGYVKMLDERDGFVADDQLHLTFNRKPVLQRIAIVAAGPIANFLLAIIAYWILFTAGVSGIAPILGDISEESAAGRGGFSQGQEIVSIDGKSTYTWSEVNLALFSRIGDTGSVSFRVKPQGASDATQSITIPITNWLSGSDNPSPASDLGLQLNYPSIPAIIGGIVEGEAAARSGLQADDEILSFAGEPVEDWSDLVGKIQANGNTTVDMTVLRGGSEEITFSVTPKLVTRDGKEVGFLGASRKSAEWPAEMKREVSYPIYSAWIPALEKTWSVTVFTLSSMKKMIEGAISHKNLSGPITIAKVASATAKSGIESFIGFIALLSISLGVLNLLPIPILDGGHLLYYFVELITKRPVPEQVQIWGAQLGMFIIVGIMLLAFYNDLMRL